MDPAYSASLLRAYLGIDVYPMTPEQKAQLDAEMIAFGEFYKGCLDIINNLVQIGIARMEVCNYFSVVVRTGGSPTSIRTILRYTLALSKDAQLARTFISHVSQNANEVGQAFARMNKASGNVLVFIVALQVVFDLAKGDYPKCVAEIAKTALCSFCPVAAFIDLIDSIVGFLLPDNWANWPPIQVIRGMNPAQCSAQVVENICYLVYIFAMALRNDWKEVAAACAKLCNAIEKSPLGVYTFLSRDFALILDDYMPNAITRTRFLGIYGLSINDWAQVARAEPHAY
jgi:hypothetical protein